MKLKLVLTALFTTWLLTSCASYANQPANTSVEDRKANTKELQIGKNNQQASQTKTNNEGVKLITNRDSKIQTLLASIQAFTNLKPEEQKLSIETSNKALLTNKNDLNQKIQLAAMLTLANKKLRNPTKAKEILDALSQDASLNAEDAALISLMQAYTSHLQTAQKDLKRYDLKQDILLQRNEKLSRKLKDLKNIEKTMNNRKK